MKKIKGTLLQIKELYSIPGDKRVGSDSTVFESNKKLFAEVEKAHKEYVSGISTPDMAMSLELANFMLTYCLSNKPTALLDLGSGFSSYIFRLYQKHSDAAVTVHSIDDHDEWLEKTKLYLAARSLNTDHLYNLETFQQDATALSFDFILLDLNFVEKRKDYIDFSVNLLNPTGALIIDDVHKIEFLRQVKEKAKSLSCKLFNIKNQTKDSFGRFSILLKK